MAARLHLQLRSRNTQTAGVGCEEDCECMQALFRFQDDFCGVPPPNGVDLNDDWDNNSILNGNVVQVLRSNGWWSLITQAGQINTQNASLQKVGLCFGVPNVPGEQLLVKTHVAMTPPNLVVSPGLFRFFLKGSGVSGVVLLAFETVGTSWVIHIEDALVTDIVDTLVPVSQDCAKPDVLRLLATSTSVKFLINGVVKHTIVTTANISSAVLGMFYELSAEVGQPAQRMDLDLVCARMSRFCRDHQSI